MQREPEDTYSAPLQIILKDVGKNQIERRFSKESFDGGVFGECFKCLKHPGAAAAFLAQTFPKQEAIIERIFSDNDLFIEPQPMQWYWDLIALRIINEKGSYN